MPIVSKWPFFMVLAASWALQGQSRPAPAGPPPIELPFGRIKPDATFDITSVRSIGAAATQVWALGEGASVLVSIDPQANQAAQPMALGSAPCRFIAADFGAVWVPLCDAKALARIDVETRALTRTSLAALAAPAGQVAAGVGSLWVLADDRGTLLRLDPETGKAVADVYLPKGASTVAFGLKSLWVASPGTNAVIRVNPHTNLIEKTIPAGPRPHTLAVGDDAVWVLGESGSTVVRLDPSANREAAMIEIAGATGAGHIAFGEGSVWVSAPGAPLVRIDPRTNHVVQRFTGAGGGPLAISHRSLWLAATDSALWRIDPRFVAALR